MAHPARRSLLIASATALLLSPTLPAQDDLRDQITRKNGKALSGRVLVPTAPQELLLLQGGKRVRVPREEIAAVDLVGDRVREFCERRITHKQSLRAQWFLVDWAETRGLPGLARAQAMLLALADPDHVEAHEFLGHRKGAKGWLWPYEGRHVTLADLEEVAAKKGFEIVGERFVVRCDGRIADGVAALLDLEQLGVVFYSRFGEALLLTETLQPIVVETSRTADTFEKWGFRPRPYYTPPPHGDVARTYYSGVAPTRPEELFFVATEALLYRSLIGEVNRQSGRDRACAWLEIGLGMHLEHTMQGPAGFAAPGRMRGMDLQALRAMSRDFRLSALLHLPMYGGFYLLDDTPTAMHWSAATMFVTWLLEPDNKPATREPFLNYVRQALGEGKGDSSSLFDRAMGMRIEELEEPWSAWLANKAGK